MTTTHACECLRDESRTVCGRPNALPYRVPLDGKNVVTHLCADCALFMGARPPYECEQDRVARADRQKELEHYKRRAEDADALLQRVVNAFEDYEKRHFVHFGLADVINQHLARVPSTLPPSVIAAAPGLIDSIVRDNQRGHHQDTMDSAYKVNSTFTPEMPKVAPGASEPRPWSADLMENARRMDRASRAKEIAHSMPKVSPGVAPVPEREVLRLTLPGRDHPVGWTCPDCDRPEGVCDCGRFERGMD